MGMPTRRWSIPQHPLAVGAKALERQRELWPGPPSFGVGRGKAPRQLISGVLLSGPTPHPGPAALSKRCLLADVHDAPPREWGLPAQAAASLARDLQPRRVRSHGALARRVHHLLREEQPSRISAVAGLWLGGRALRARRMASRPPEPRSVLRWRWPQGSGLEVYWGLRRGKAAPPCPVEWTPAPLLPLRLDARSALLVTRAHCPEVLR